MFAQPTGFHGPVGCRRFFRIVIELRVNHRQLYTKVTSEPLSVSDRQAVTEVLAMARSSSTPFNVTVIAVLAPILQTDPIVEDALC